MLSQLKASFKIFEVVKNHLTIIYCWNGTMQFRMAAVITHRQTDGFTELIFEVMIYEVCKLYFQRYYNNLNEYNITLL